MNSKEEKLKKISRLLDIVDELRVKCPWDIKQTFESMRPLTIEETYELAQAISDKDTQEIKNELGDVLLHIFFYSKMASETNDFDIADVADAISKKLIYRHPHVYGETKVSDDKEVKRNWEQLKLKEKGNKKTILQGVPRGLPSLVKASRIIDKVRSAGFKWSDESSYLDKIKEEISEFEQAKANKSESEMEDEFGDILFSLVSYADVMGINPDNALARANNKFTNRFEKVEKTLKGKSFVDCSEKELNNLWGDSK